MRLSKFNIIYFFVLLLLGCDLTDDSLIIHNKMSNDVYFIIKPDCKDTILSRSELDNISFETRNSSEDYLHSFNGKISANDRVHIVNFSSWRGYVQNNCNQQLMIFFIANDEMEKIKNDKEIIDFLKYKRTLSLAKLDSINWEIEVDYLLK